MRHGPADRARPNRGIVYDEAGQEVLIFSGRHSLVQARSDQLIARALAPVPRAVLGRKDIPAVFRGKLAALIDDHPRRGRMGLDQHVGDGDLIL